MTETSLASTAPNPAEPIAGELDAEGRATVVHTASSDVLDTRLMRVECGFTRGFTGLQLIGNTSEVTRDGKERARSALESLGIHIPPRRLVISMTPADVKKDGNHFDLPLAVSLALLLTERPARIDAARWLFAAELGLTGELRPVKGVVSFAVAALAAELDGVVVAAENLAEIHVLSSLQPHREQPLKAMAFSNLKDLLSWIETGGDEATVVTRPGRADRAAAKAPDFDDMILTPTLARAAMVATAGMHSLLLRGCPGTGKSMLAARLASILPPLDREEHVEVMRVYSSFSERIPPALLAGRPPFRAPHHQASAAAVLGTPEAPGELALAHGGVLFLDELPEFRRDLLEALREPLETGEIRVSRSKRKIAWRCRAILVAACNNCPCGWAASRRRLCDCGQGRLAAYRARISGPLLDRIDLHVNVEEPSEETADLFIRLADARPAPAHGASLSATADMRARVGRAREFALRRNAAFSVTVNRDLQAHHLLAASGLEKRAFAALVNRYVPRSASSRAVIRCLRVARTLADLDEHAEIRPEDLSQAWRWQAEPSARDRGETCKSGLHG